MAERKTTNLNVDLPEQLLRQTGVRLIKSQAPLVRYDYVRNMVIMDKRAISNINLDVYREDIAIFKNEL